MYVVYSISLLFYNLYMHVNDILELAYFFVHILINFDASDHLCLDNLEFGQLLVNLTVWPKSFNSTSIVCDILYSDDLLSFGTSLGTTA